MCLSNDGLHGCHIDEGNISGAETDVGEANSIVDSEEMA